jgi:hypothetical protein
MFGADKRQGYMIVALPVFICFGADRPAFNGDEMEYDVDGPRFITVISSGLIRDLHRLL